MLFSTLGGVLVERSNAKTIMLATNVIRAVEGPLANIQDQAPEATKYPGNSEPLTDVWIAVRASLRRVLDQWHLEPATCIAQAPLPPPTIVEARRLPSASRSPGAP